MRENNNLFIAGRSFGKTGIQTELIKRYFKMNYFLLHDDSVMSHFLLVSSNSQLESPPPIFVASDYKEFPFCFSCPYLNRITNRRLSFVGQKFSSVPNNFQRAAGWDIDKEQYGTLKRISELLLL